ncbi:MAG: DUF2188 domain-containing protein [Saprospiraceae bacterium]|jgi:hypothetical protein|nr:DUF2188 domain-containing protein [Saprospiraceae bacterium]MBP6568776.1 DUF2188 domain-containing protein [Saprospiraceae bacterium]
MTKLSNHVVPSAEKNGWTIKKAGRTNNISSFVRKEDAIKFAREMSKSEKTELYIHKRNGIVQTKYSYV